MEKNSKEKQYIIDNIDRAINELVYEKTQIIKAYNYYHGKRDPEQFRHLEEHYGIGTPTSIEFIPLARNHIDVLIGEYLSTPVKPRISCKDNKTLSAINKEKQNKIHQEIVGELKKHLTNSINGENVSDVEIEQRLKDIYDDLSLNYVSEYEISSQFIVNWLMQNESFDFANKRKMLLLDLLISGTAYYKEVPSPSKTSINLKILNPINTFIDRNQESPYLKKSPRAVSREYLTKDQILARYGEYLTNDDLDTLETISDYTVDGATTTYLRTYDSITGNTTSDGILGGFEITPLLPYERNTSKYFRMFPVYEVEWLKTEKEDNHFITNRYEGVRIGTKIYITLGKNKDVSRSIEDPYNCDLSINGLFFSDRNGEPFSLVLKTANLQDKNDILYFFRDNIIAESGTSGDWIDMPFIPKFLGTDEAERLLKWKAYKKGGMALLDSSQEGISMANTTFSGYDDTLKLQAIQAFDLAIQRNEDTCSKITGVFRERLGSIEQKDAVTNVQLGVRQSALVTKQWYQVMDLLTREILLDALNLTKVVFKSGITGMLVLGDNLNKIFTSSPKYYTLTDHDIHIADSSETIQEQETIKQLGMELTKGNLVDPGILIDIITSKSLTSMKQDVKASLSKKKKENDQLNQLSQQLKQMEQQLKQTEQAAQQMQQKISSLNEEKLQLEKDRLQFETKLEWYVANNDSQYKNSKLELDKKRMDLEALQLVDINKKNDEIRNE